MLIDKIISKKVQLAPSREVKKLKSVIDFIRVSRLENPTDYFFFSNSHIGQMILRHECEEKSDFQSRCLRTPVRPYLSQIYQKYEGSAFRNWPTFSSSDSNLQSKIVSLAKKIFFEIFHFFGTVLVLKSEEYFLFKFDDLVIVENDEFLFSSTDENGEQEFIYIDANQNILARVSKNYEILEFDTVAVFPIISNSALAYQIAVCQRNVHNLFSLLADELVNATFTKFILSGVAVSPQDELNKLSWSSKRLVIIPEKQARLDTVSSDIRVCDVILRAIAEEEKNIYKIAGISIGENQSNISAESLYILREDFHSQISYFIDLIEEVLQKAFREAGVVFSRKFESDDELRILQTVKNIYDSNMPQNFKKFILKNYLEKYTNLNEQNILNIISE